MGLKYMLGARERENAREKTRCTRRMNMKVYFKNKSDVRLKGAGNERTNSDD